MKRFDKKKFYKQGPCHYTANTYPLHEGVRKINTPSEGANTRCL